MELAKSLKQMCPCGFEIRIELTSGENKHQNCVFDLKLSDLAVRYPEHSDLIAKLWEICHTQVDFWFCAKIQYWEEKGVTYDTLRMDSLIKNHPEDKDAIIDLWHKKKQATTFDSEYSFDDYAEILRQMDVWTAKGVDWDPPDVWPDVSQSELEKFAYNKVQLWELTETLGNDQHKLTKDDFPWVKRKSILTDDVIGFCQEMTY
jgi:hypothetical protein